jgi:NTP pyrophosphatase (non-canonical NTP hydrolase)
MKVDMALNERLTILIEECSEVQKTACKAIRFGIDNAHPETGAINRELLERELGDLMNIISMMLKTGDIKLSKMVEASVEKEDKIAQYLKHQF